MKILVLGGTGAMGSHLVRILKVENEVVVTSRRQLPAEDGLRYACGNAQDETFIRVLLTERWDAIIDFMVYSTECFRQRRDLFLNATSQYVFLSSSRVYAESAIPLTENSPRLLDVSKDKDFLASDEYALSKARQENMLFDAKSKNWTIIRPYITFNAQRLQLGVLEKEDWLYRALSGRTIVFSREINEKATTLTYGVDVATGIAAILGREEALGEVFHITSPKSIFWREVLAVYRDTLNEELGREQKIKLAEMNVFLSCHHSKYQIFYDRLYNRKFNNKKISKFVDVNNFSDPLIALKKNLKDFLREPVFIFVNGKMEARKDRVTGEITPIAEFFEIKQKLKYIFFRNNFGY